MGANAMEMRVCMQKTLIITMKTCYRSAHDHPFVVSMLFFFLFLYRFLPSLFFFLVSSSPVIICTAVLLGTLLSFGNPYIPEFEEEEEVVEVEEVEEEEEEKTSHGISSLKSGVVENKLVVEKGESFSVRTHVDKSRGLNEKDLIFTEKPHEDDAYVSESSSDEVEELRKEEKRVIDEEKPLIEDENDIEVQYSSLRENEIEGEDVENFGSVQYSSILNRFEDNEVSSEYDSDSDRAESSSPDASMAEIMPMLDELHPLLDSEPSQPAVLSVDDDDEDGSEESPSSSEESEEDEVENVEVEDEEEEEQQGGQDDGTEAVVTWTKEDEKNLMDLGNSELERNRRLESLIARRRARKNFRMMMTEKNLIDLDGGDPPFHMPQISTARRNPFDIHYDSNEGMDLPPIPGSAPSALAPRRNPFDIPYDPLEERPNLAGGSFEEEFLTSQEKETHFRRYESFSVGPSFLGEPKQMKPASKFRPYFVPEQVHSEGIGYPTFQRQLSEISESKMSSVTETESVSSASDQDNQENVTEEKLSHPVVLVEQQMSQPFPHVERALDAKVESSSSEEVDLAEIDDEHHVDAAVEEENFNDIESTSPEIESKASRMSFKPEVVEEKQSDSSSSLSVVNDDVKHHADAAVDEEYFNDRDSSSPEFESIASPMSFKPEVVEEKQSDSSSSLSVVNDDVNTNEGFEHPELTTDDTIANSSMQTSVEDSYLRNEIEEREDDQMKEPVYDDWHPSEGEKTLSGITIIEEALRYTSTSSAASNMPVEMLEIGLTPMQVDRTIASLEEESLVHNGNLEEETVSVNEEQWAATSHLHAVEENELKSREVTMINEHDVIKAGFSGNYPNDDVIAPMPQSVSEEFVHDVGSSSSVTDVDDNSVTKEANIQLEHNEVHVSSSSPHPVHVDVPQSNVDEAGQVSSENSTLSGTEVEDENSVTKEANDQLEHNEVDVSSSSPHLVHVDVPQSDVDEVGPKALKVSSEDSTLSWTEVEDENSVTREANVQLEHNEVHVSSSSPHPVHIDVPQSNVDETGPEALEMSSKDSTHIMSEAPPPLLEKPMVHSLSGSDHEKSQDPSSPVAVSVKALDTIDDSFEAVHVDRQNNFSDHSALVSSVTSFPSEVTENEPATSEINFEDNFHEKVQNNIYSKDLEHSDVSHVTNAIEVADEEFDVVEDINEIDEEFLIELDVVGDFGVKELGTNTNQMENVLVPEVHEARQVLETNSFKAVGDDVHKTPDTTEAFADPQVREVRSVEEVHSSKDVEEHSHKSEDPAEALTDTEAGSVEVDTTPKQLTVNEMDDRLKTFDSEVSGELSAKLSESDLEITSVSREVMADETRASVESNSNAKERCETSSSSNTDESKKKTDLDALGDISVDVPETNTNKTESTSVVEVQESLAGIKVLEDNSSKVVEENYKTHGTGTMEVVENLQDLEAESEEDLFFTPKVVSINKIEEQFKPIESESAETSVAVLESVIDVKPDAENLMAEETRTSVIKRSNSEAEETHEVSTSGITDEGDVKTVPNAVNDISAEELVATKSENDVAQRSLTLLEAPEENSSKDVAEESHKTKVSIEVQADSSALEPRLEGDVHFTPKELSVDEISTTLKESSIEVKPTSEDSSDKESMSGVEETGKASSSNTTVEKKKKGSGKSSSSSSSSSSDSD